jgi:O-acetyl-ADP-ribose deacetylase (regulator of RNase III)
MITYVRGDATRPASAGNKIIAHVCNDIGAWGKGFVMSITMQYPTAEQAYRSWCQGNDDQQPFMLGEVQFVKVSDDVYVANMIGQHGIMIKDGITPIRYNALEKCLQTLRLYAQTIDASIHMPRIGCGLAGGEWNKVEALINTTIPDLHVVVYDYTAIDSILDNDKRFIPWKV